LRDEEEQHDVGTQKPAEVDPGGVQKQAVANKHHGADSESAHLLQARGMVQARLDARISLHFKISGHSKNGERSKR
jgi:hypothetical protein